MKKRLVQLERVLNTDETPKIEVVWDIKLEEEYLAERGGDDLIDDAAFKRWVRKEHDTIIVTWPEGEEE